MNPLPYVRPLIKVSGEALVGANGYGIDPAMLGQVAADVAEVMAEGRKVAIVVGGGNIFRGVLGVADGMDRVKADRMGMLATVINALALEQALIGQGRPTRVYSGLPVPTVCANFDRDKAKEDLEDGRAVILAGGTGNPFFTTDTTATLRAAELGCDAVLKATQVDGVYSADPKRTPGAERFDKLDFDEVLQRDLKVMDAAAIALARDNAIPIVIFSLHCQGAIGKVLRGEAKCTIVEGKGRPSR